MRRAASRCATVSDWTGLPVCGVTLRGDRDLAAEQVQSPGIESIELVLFNLADLTTRVLTVLVRAWFTRREGDGARPDECPVRTAQR